MAIDKEIKKKVIEDWQNTFPQLTLYAQDRLYKIVGPIIIGLELIKLPRTDEYRPHFVIYPLFGNKMGNDVKACFAGPILLQEYSNKKGFQYNIPYTKHSTFFREVVESVKKQSPLPFDSNISLTKILNVIDEYSKKPPLSAAPNSYLQAVIQEVKLKIALFKSVEEAQNVLGQINKRDWDISHFKACNVDINKWRQELQELISNRDKFLKQIELNKEEKK